MLRKIFTLVCLFFFALAITIKPVNAQIDLESPSPSSSLSPADSYTLFWPVTAGKTVDDSLYILKDLKERIMGMFIFGENEKADYAVQLATKRIVEVEKLLQENKTEPAEKTLEKAKTHLQNAENSLISAKEKNKSNPNANINTKKQLENLRIFLPTLKSSVNEVTNKLSEVDKLINSIAILLP